MGIFEGVLLVSDMDGTLLDQNEKVSKENIEAIKYFKAEGGIFTLASGRNAINMDKAIDFAEPNAPIIADNGSLIVDHKTGKCLKKHLMGDEVIPAALDIEKAFPASSIEIYTSDNFYACKFHDSIKRPEYFLKTAIFGTLFTDVPRPWSKVVFMQTPEESTKMREYVETRPFFNDFNIIRADKHFVEILHKSASKGGCLPYIKSLFPNIYLTVSAGDNENDLTMIKDADIGYATENAAPILKAAADRIAPHHNNSAISSIICDIEKQVRERK